MKFETEYIEKLAKIISENGLTEISLEDGEQAVTTQISTQNVGEYNVMDVMPKGDSKEDKLFREALLSGREYGKYYSLFSDNNKKFNVDKLVKYCKEHNYSFFSVGKKPVKEFYFMPN